MNAGLCRQLVNLHLKKVGERVIVGSWDTRTNKWYMVVTKQVLSVTTLTQLQILVIQMIE